MATITRFTGITVPGSGLRPGGGYEGLTTELDASVAEAADLLASHFGTDVEIRFNSDRLSGGAWLNLPGGTRAEIGIRWGHGEGCSVMTYPIARTGFDTANWRTFNNYEIFEMADNAAALAFVIAECVPVATIIERIAVQRALFDSLDIDPTLPKTPAARAKAIAKLSSLPAEPSSSTISVGDWIGFDGFWCRIAGVDDIGVALIERRPGRSQIVFRSWADMAGFKPDVRHIGVSA